MGNCIYGKRGTASNGLLHLSDGETASQQVLDEQTVLLEPGMLPMPYLSSLINLLMWEIEADLYND